MFFTAATAAGGPGGRAGEWRALAPGFGGWRPSWRFCFCLVSIEALGVGREKFLFKGFLHLMCTASLSVQKL